MLEQANATPALPGIPSTSKSGRPRLFVHEIKLSNKLLTGYNIGNLVRITDEVIGELTFQIRAKGPNYLVLRAPETLVFRSKRHLEHFIRFVYHQMRTGVHERRVLTAAQIASRD